MTEFGSGDEACAGVEQKQARAQYHVQVASFRSEK